MTHKHTQTHQHTDTQTHRHTDTQLIFLVPDIGTAKAASMVPTQGLEHINFDNTGTVKVASTFNLNIEALSKHVVNRLKYDHPLVALAVCKLTEPTIIFPANPSDSSNLIKTTKWQRKYNHLHDQQKWWDKNTQKIYNLAM